MKRLTKKILFGLGSIAAVSAPIATVIAIAPKQTHTRAADPIDTTIKARQWNVGGFTIQNPHVETLSAFLARKANLINPLTQEGAEMYLLTYQNTQNPAIRFFIGTDAQFEEYRKNLPIVEKSDKGLLVDDIALLHISINELLNSYAMWLPYSALAEKQRVKMVIEIITKYNLELVNKDFDSTFTIPSRDRGVLITGLTIIKEHYPDHFALMVKPFKLEAEATPDEVWTAYETQMEKLHATHSTPDLTGSGIGQGI